VDKGRNIFNKSRAIRPGLHDKQKKS
jgi:hypothetical protein